VFGYLCRAGSQKRQTETQQQVMGAGEREGRGRGETGVESRALVVLEGGRAEGVVVGQSRKCEASNLAASRLRACLLGLVFRSRSTAEAASHV
jgi:hypothetical protein